MPYFNKPNEFSKNFNKKSPFETRLGRWLMGRKKHTSEDGSYTAVTDKKGRVVKEKQVNPDSSVTKTKRSRKVRKNQANQ
tara:strand:+ start:43 stop:282 length:240 start_codon:yes stop_codon:yes gene_type:complete